MKKKKLWLCWILSERMVRRSCYVLHQYLDCAVRIGVMLLKIRFFILDDGVYLFSFDGCFLNVSKRHGWTVYEFLH